MLFTQDALSHINHALKAYRKALKKQRASAAHREHPLVQSLRDEKKQTPGIWFLVLKSIGLFFRGHWNISKTFKRLKAEALERLTRTTISLFETISLCKEVYPPRLLSNTPSYDCFNALLAISQMPELTQLLPLLLDKFEYFDMLIEEFRRNQQKGSSASEKNSISMQNMLRLLSSPCEGTHDLDEENCALHRKIFSISNLILLKEKNLTHLSYDWLRKTSDPAMRDSWVLDRAYSKFLDILEGLYRDQTFDFSAEYLEKMLELRDQRLLELGGDWVCLVNHFRDFNMALIGLGGKAFPLRAETIIRLTQHLDPRIASIGMAALFKLDPQLWEHLLSPETKLSVFNQKVSIAGHLSEVGILDQALFETIGNLLEGETYAKAICLISPQSLHTDAIPLEVYQQHLWPWLLRSDTTEIGRLAWLLQIILKAILRSHAQVDVRSLIEQEPSVQNLLNWGYFYSTGASLSEAPLSKEMAEEIADIISQRAHSQDPLVIEGIYSSLCEIMRTTRYPKVAVNYCLNGVVGVEARIQRRPALLAAFDRCPEFVKSFLLNDLKALDFIDPEQIAKILNHPDPLQAAHACHQLSPSAGQSENRLSPQQWDIFLETLLEAPQPLRLASVFEILWPTINRRGILGEIPEVKDFPKPISVDTLFSLSGLSFPAGMADKVADFLFYFWKDLSPLEKEDYQYQFSSEVSSSYMARLLEKICLLEDAYLTEPVGGVFGKLAFAYCRKSRDVLALEQGLALIQSFIENRAVLLQKPTSDGLFELVNLTDFDCRGLFASLSEVPVSEDPYALLIKINGMMSDALSSSGGHAWLRHKINLYPQLRSLPSQSEPEFKCYLHEVPGLSVKWLDLVLRQQYPIVAARTLMCLWRLSREEMKASAKSIGMTAALDSLFCLIIQQPGASELAEFLNILLMSEFRSVKPSGLRVDWVEYLCDAPSLRRVLSLRVECSQLAEPEIDAIARLLINAADVFAGSRYLSDGVFNLMLPALVQMVQEVPSSFRHLYSGSIEQLFSCAFSGDGGFEAFEQALMSHSTPLLVLKLLLMCTTEIPPQSERFSDVFEKLICRNDLDAFFHVLKNYGLRICGMVGLDVLDDLCETPPEVLGLFAMCIDGLNKPSDSLKEWAAELRLMISQYATVASKRILRELAPEPWLLYNLTLLRSVFERLNEIQQKFPEAGLSSAEIARVFQSKHPLQMAHVIFNLKYLRQDPMLYTTRFEQIEANLQSPDKSSGAQQTSTKVKTLFACAVRTLSSATFVSNFNLGKVNPKVQEPTASQELTPAQRAAQAAIRRAEEAAGFSENSC